ncbi:unnamed protein product [Sympodiomycopsis kandeliae]
MLRNTLAFSALAALGVSAQYSATYQASPSGLPDKTEQGQTGTNKCGTDSNPNSQCQNSYLNSIDDFCLWGPPVQGEVAAHEGDVVAYCTKAGRGTRTIPNGAIHGAQFVKAPHYVQVTGTGDFTGMNIVSGDSGGELDPHGADGTGNPKGGIVFHCENGKCSQYHEWMQFMSANEFCFRACRDGPRATSLCRHTYDELGCGFNMPASYPTDHFESCESNDAEDIAFYGGSYFAQDMTKTGAQVPGAHAPPQSSNCFNVDANAIYGAVSGNAFGGNSPVTSTSSSSSSSATSSSTTSSMSSSSSSSSSMSTSIVTSSAPGGITTIRSTLAAGPTSTAESGSSRNNNTSGAALSYANHVGAAAIVAALTVAAGAFIL